MKPLSTRVSLVFCLAALILRAETVLAGSYQVGVAPSTVKVMIQGAARGWPFEGWTADHYDLYLARGEHEAMQVVVMAIDALSNACVDVSQPQGAQGEGALAGEAKAWLVGHVDVIDQPMNNLNVEYPSYLVNYRGWWPDPLLTFTNTCNINAGDRVAFWIDVSTRPEATAGDYVATIAVTADDSPTTNLQLNIHVWDFELPLKASLPSAFSLNKVTSDGGGAATLYGSDYETKGIERQFWDLLLDRRMGFTHLYVTTAESFDAISYWAARGESALELKRVNTLDHVRDPELATLFSRVRGAGLLDMAYVYGFDEAESDKFPTMASVFGEVHSRYPGLRTMTTARDSSFGTSPSTSYLRSAVDIWVPETPVYKQAEAVKLRAEGKDMWWYTCIGPHHPYANFFIEYAAIEPRLLMGLMSHKYQTGGFLYYNIANWPLARLRGPITSGPYTNWDPTTVFNSSGDGSLCCAAPDGPIPTIRIENIRDGLEDYEYLKLLEDLYDTLQGGCPSTPEQVAWLASAQQLLTVPSNLVSSMVSYTRDPALLENYRRQVASAILTGQALTVALPPDADGDGDVDLSDFGYFQACLSEDAVSPVAPACQCADLNDDGHVDGGDLTLFQGCMSGPGIPFDPHCVD